MILEKKHNRVSKKISGRARTCMFNGCNEKAIKSHVLQKNGILKQISEDNHLIQLVRPNAFKIKKDGILQFKKVGINDVYTFKGFCKRHDSDIFKPIESKQNLNIDLPYHQALFSYRGLCQEIRRKEFSLEWIAEMKNELPIEALRLYNSLRDGYEAGIKNLNYFKTELEYAINNQFFENFFFESIEIPKIDLCISVPLNVGENENPEKIPYEEWKKKRPLPFTTSFINVFPIRNKSYLIGGYHKKYPCEWTDKKLIKFRHSKSKVVKKELSDLIVLRLEFWAMSPQLFRSIPDKMLRKYKSRFLEEIYNHSGQMKTKINLFK